MEKKKMSNKTLLIILGIIVVLSIVLIIVMSSNNKKDNGNLKLKCVANVKLGATMDLTRTSEIYDKNGDLIYIESQEYISKNLTDEIFEILKSKTDAIMALYKDVAGFEYDMTHKDNLVFVKIKLNLSAISKNEELLKGFNLGSNLVESQDILERSGFKCEDY